MHIINWGWFQVPLVYNRPIRIPQENISFLLILPRIHWTAPRVLNGDLMEAGEYSCTNGVPLRLRSSSFSPFVSCRLSGNTILGISPTDFCKNALLKVCIKELASMSVFPACVSRLGEKACFSYGAPHPPSACPLSHSNYLHCQSLRKPSRQSRLWSIPG